MNRYLTKLSMLVQQYQHSETGKTMWHQEGKELPGKGWEKVKGRARYIKRGQGSK